MRHRVRTLVNKVDNDGPELIEEVPDEGGEGGDGSDSEDASKNSARSDAGRDQVHQGRFDL